MESGSSWTEFTSFLNKELIRNLTFLNKDLGNSWAEFSSFLNKDLIRNL